MLKVHLMKVALGGAFFAILSSCGQKKEEYLKVKLIPKDTLVLEVPAAYSCMQIVAGIASSDGILQPEVQGPLIQFNRMQIQWTKENVPVHIHSAKLRILGNGIEGGETTCDLTLQLMPLFESPGANNATKIKGGEIFTNERIDSNPNCRIPCTIPLVDPDRPEIMATGELIVKASEVSNSGTDEEIWHRVKSTFRFTIRP